MRRRYFYWAYLVLALVLSIYGGYSLIYCLRHNKDISILGLVFFIIGILMLLIFLILFIISYFQKKNRPVEVAETKEEPILEEVQAELEEEKAEEIVEKEESASSVTYSSRDDTEYEPVRSYRSFDGGSGYVRMVGYGPVLRISEEDILDMRNNTYYRIEGNLVKQLGSGPIFEINRNKIKNAFGGYLYEISGDSVYKVYGGYYASISVGYLQNHDLKEKYEIPSDLNMSQKLAVVALLFGNY